jgi:pimeloyl-ACP methyl ester carboxylesterase
MISVSHCSQRNLVPAAVGMFATIPNQRGSQASRRVREGSGSLRRVAATSDDPQRWSVEHDGLAIGALDWGGDGPPLVLLHPNGFCAGVFEPLARALRGDYRTIGIDLRGHGTSDAPSSADACGFDAAAGDVVAMLEYLGLDEVVLLGESLGGGTGILVDRLRPGLVRKLLLCEPIAMPSAGGLPGAGSENHMSAMARRRRAVWDDRETVLASYASRPPLNTLEPEALAGYVRWGFRDRPDGQVELSCPPDVEAWFFECGTRPDGAPASFEHLASLHCDVTIVCSDGTDLPGGMFPAQAERAGVNLVVVPGTHFFVQENTARAAALVLEHLVW